MCLKMATTASPQRVRGSSLVMNCETLSTMGITTISHRTAISSSDLVLVSGNLRREPNAQTGRATGESSRDRIASLEHK